MAVHTVQDLKQMQALPLLIKIRMTEQRIRDWVNEFGEEGVYISFSGGKDSTVLLDIARKLYPGIKAMFVDVPTQYPELKEFAMQFDNVDIVKPKIGFPTVCKKYGFPLISKEVSECVWGARRYLTSILEDETILTDRQTDIQNKPYYYWYERVCGSGKYAKPNEGGYDSKYRRIRGLGEFVKPANEGKEGRSESEVGDHVGNVHEGQGEPDKGKYP